MEAVRVFIGCEPKAKVAAAVLDFSIRARTKAVVQTFFMDGLDWTYDHGKIKMGTGFSLRRWMIPRFCEWTGRAIYLDADTLVLSDLQDMWTLPDQEKYLPGTAAWCVHIPDRGDSRIRAQTSTMVLDCAAAKGQWGFDLQQTLRYLHSNSDRNFYSALMHGEWMTPNPAVIDSRWNCFEKVRKGAKILHYTREDTQPWYNPRHPFRQVWEDELAKALAAGVVSKSDVRDALLLWKAPRLDSRKFQGLHPYYAYLLDK